MFVQKLKKLNCLILVFKYIGLDSNGPIRIRVNEIHENNPTFTGTPNSMHTTPHFHIDRRAKVYTGKWGKTFTGPMEMFR